MKKYSTVVATLAGIALGAGCMLVAVLVINREPRPVSSLQQEDSDETALDGLAAEFSITKGAAPGYIDDRSCAECHRELYDAYQQVGMAKSFSRPSGDNLVENLENSKFYHAPSRRYFEMKRQDDALVFTRHQLDDEGQPINSFERKVDWIVGSGNHARQYLYQTEQGELFELPVAWYSQEDKWAMAPDFKGRFHQGVTKQVNRDCLFCHNAFPDVATGSDVHGGTHRFPKDLPEGIGCQRCHGPGAKHVQVARDKSSDKEDKRASIVNPADLDTGLQQDVCNQCHLQPTSSTAGVRRFGRGDYSFRPGQALAEYLVGIDVSQQKQTNAERFELNHHSYRLRHSRCFEESPEGLKCIQCHDPHRKVPADQRVAHYRAACLSCHETDACSVEANSPEHQTLVDAGDCASCHMPRRRTQDAVHVAMTDHLISRTMLDESLDEPSNEELVLTDAFLASQDNNLKEDQAAVYRSVALLRLSQFTHVPATNQLENLLISSDNQQVEAYVDLIMAQLKQKRFAAAKNTASQMLAEAKDHPLAVEWQGTALMSLKQFDLAEKQFRQALKLNPDRAEAHFNLALVMLDTERTEEALSELKETIELRPNMVLAWYYLGLAYSELEQREDAVRAFRRALQFDPTHSRSYLAIGEQFMAVDRPHEARRFWQLGIRVAPRGQPIMEAFQNAQFAIVRPILASPPGGDSIDPVNERLVAVPLPRLGELEESVAEQLRGFQEALIATVASDKASTDDLAAAYATLGQLYHVYEFQAAAERCYVNALRLTPSDYSVYHLLAALYEQAGRLTAAETFFDTALQLYPKNLAAAVRLGNIYLQANRKDEAIRLFQYALSLDNNSASAHSGLGDAALAEQKYTKAIQHYGIALERAPGATRLHYSLAMAYRGLGDLDKAQAHLDQRGAAGVRPADPIVDGLANLLTGERVHLIRGRLAMGAHDYQSAAAAFAKAVEANETSIAARVNYGTVLVHLGQRESAVEQYRAALELAPENETALFNLATLLLQQGEHEEAVTRFEAVLNSKPKDATARLRLAVTLRKMDRRVEARSHLHKILIDSPENEDALLELSSVLTEQKLYSDSLKVLDEGSRLFPGRGMTEHALAKFLATCDELSLRDGKRAVELATKLVKTQPTIEFRETLALALAENGRCEEAAELQKQLIAEAEKGEDQDLISRLTQRLPALEKGSPCRPTANKSVAAPAADGSPKSEPDAAEPASEDAQ
jgi:tetratricopeptide (TPR) repeat protein